MGKKTILLVDDTPDNIQIMSEILLPQYMVRAANCGAKALTAASSEPRPDLILLDVMMPEMDGYEVIRRLRINPVTRDIPVIFVTALDATEDEAHGLALGAADYITKPVCPAIVQARVRIQLELKEAREHMRNQNAWLETEVNRRMRLNQITQDVSLRALASLAEARDTETGKHILRTQSYVSLLAQTLAKLPKYSEILTPNTIESYVKAAPLHDIGKVGIPDSVLRKPSKLLPDEWEIMKTHAKIGADAILRATLQEEDQSDLEFLHVAIQIAGNHHEKWDGTGYPNGLSGEQIPLSARLMALADVFDALLNKRVYKDSYSFEAVTSMIIEQKGKHFDPDIVDAYLANLNNFRAVVAHYSASSDS